MSKTPSWRVAVRFRLSTLAALLTVMAILLTATMPAAEARTRTAVTDIANRGSSGSAPENTLAAVELALMQAVHSRADSHAADHNSLAACADKPGDPRSACDRRAPSDHRRACAPPCAHERATTTSNRR